ncbi:hypothetical protein FJZ26_01235 [Candidatus Parvarchaeota archaeon]|nr:hypothetical protein [Candidatus Parvarchaeota archaeon]
MASKQPLAEWRQGFGETEKGPKNENLGNKKKRGQNRIVEKKSVGTQVASNDHKKKQAETENVLGALKTSLGKGLVPEISAQDIAAMPEIAKLLVESEVFGANKRIRQGAAQALDNLACTQGAASVAGYFEAGLKNQTAQVREVCARFLAASCHFDLEKSKIREILSSNDAATLSGTCAGLKLLALKEEDMSYAFGDIAQRLATMRRGKGEAVQTLRETYQFIKKVRKRIEICPKLKKTEKENIAQIINGGNIQRLRQYMARSIQKTVYVFEIAAKMQDCQRKNELIGMFENIIWDGKTHRRFGSYLNWKLSAGSKSERMLSGQMLAFEASNYPSKMKDELLVKLILGNDELVSFGAINAVRKLMAIEGFELPGSIVPAIRAVSSNFKHPAQGHAKGIVAVFEERVAYSVEMKRASGMFLSG